jgi:hypothetical protein
MGYRLSKHVREELTRRALPLDVVEAVLAAPEQIVEGHGGKRVYQSRAFFEGNLFLVRVIVAEDEEPPVVVTAYRTRKVRKYWSEP